MQFKEESADWEKVRPVGFTRWLFKLEMNYALAADGRYDPSWPRQAKDFGDFFAYLQRYGDHVTQELLHLWSKYTGKPAYHIYDFPIEEVASTYDEAPEGREFDVVEYGDEYPAAPDGYTYLYAMCDTLGYLEDSQIRYIGQTQNPSARLTQHVLQPGRLEKLDWIAELRALDKFPYLVIFDTVPVEEANNKEQFAVFYFSWALGEHDGNWRDTLLNKAYAS